MKTQMSRIEKLRNAAKILVLGFVYVTVLVVGTIVKEISGLFTRATGAVSTRVRADTREPAPHDQQPR